MVVSVRKSKIVRVVVLYAFLLFAVLFLSEVATARKFYITRDSRGAFALIKGETVQVYVEAKGARLPAQLLVQSGGANLTITRVSSVEPNHIFNVIANTAGRAKLKALVYRGRNAAIIPMFRDLRVFNSLPTYVFLKRSRADTQGVGGSGIDWTSWFDEYSARTVIEKELRLYSTFYPNCIWKNSFETSTSNTAVDTVLTGFTTNYTDLSISLTPLVYRDILFKKPGNYRVDQYCSVEYGPDGEWSARDIPRVDPNQKNLDYMWSTLNVTVLAYTYNGE